ncbi:hypothetical protein FRC02_001593 [Tulasnella sp. 418]|nr:hypothetical protein FRC02_001593 [Tulasnella sp. 418]
MTSERCHILLLPKELLLIVLELNFDPGLDWKWETTPFAHYSLVCSAWRPIVQKMLFTQVHLHSERCAQRFLSAIWNNPSLSSITQVLSISSSVVRTPHLYLIRNITSRCSNVHQIMLDVTDEVTGQDLNNLFHPQTFISLRSLRFSLDANPSGFYHRENISMHQVATFVAKFQSLSSLAIKQPFQAYTSSDDSPLPTPLFQLSELHWDDHRSGFYGRGETSLYLLDWLLESQALTQVRKLGIKADADLSKAFSKWTPFLEVHGDRLTSLSLWEPSETLVEHAAPIFKACPNLQEIIIPNSILSSDLRASLPTANLQRLEFGTADAITVPVYHRNKPKSSAVGMEEQEKIIDWITSLPKIRNVILHLATAQDPVSPAWKRCGATGVQVEFVHRENNALIERHHPFREARSIRRRRNSLEMERMLLD